MPHSLKSLAVSALLAANLAGYASTASALPAIDPLAIKNATPNTIEPVQWRGWGWGWGWAAPAVAAGVITGAVVGSALARPYYYGPGPYYPYYPYYAPAPAGYYAPGYYGPQSGEGAIAYCSRRFRSYDPRTGTYLGTDGNRHPCP
ncbi:MAG: BA14K family protein [Methylocapsa sp.]|nr:BA14K family protein [Methylocapsa sp.]